MTIYKILSGILVILAFIYFFVGLKAYSHIDKNYMGDRGSALTPIWPFNEKIYDVTGRKLCRLGRKLFLIVWGGAVIWAGYKYL